jgi:hypothetical protein
LGLALIGRVQVGEPRHMLLEVAVDQILHARGFAALVALSQRIAAKVDIAAQFPRAIPRRRHRPFGPAREGHPALPSRMAIIEGEGAPAAAVNAGREAANIIVEDLVIAPLGRDGIAQNLLAQADPFRHRGTSFPCP